jgi:hypothetical protein
MQSAGANTLDKVPIYRRQPPRDRRFQAERRADRRSETRDREGHASGAVAGTTLGCGTGVRRWQV